MRKLFHKRHGFQKGVLMRHTSELMKDLGPHFLKTAFGPSVWIQIHINIDFTKFGATAFIISFLWRRWGAHLIHQLTADNLVEPTERVLLLLCVHYSNSPFAVQYYRPMLRNTRESWILDPSPWIVDSGCWIFSGTWIPDSTPLIVGFWSTWALLWIPKPWIPDTTSKIFPDFGF